MSVNKRLFHGGRGGNSRDFPAPLLRCPVDFHGKKRIGILFWLVDLGTPFPKQVKKRKQSTGLGLFQGSRVSPESDRGSLPKKGVAKRKPSTGQLGLFHVGWEFFVFRGFTSACCPGPKFPAPRAPRSASSGSACGAQRVGGRVEGQGVGGQTLGSHGLEDAQGLEEFSCPRAGY